MGGHAAAVEAHACTGNSTKSMRRRRTAGEAIAAHNSSTSGYDSAAANESVTVKRWAKVVHEVRPAQEEWRAEDHDGRIESPAERAVEETVAGDKRVSAIPGIPVPAGADPTGTVVAVGVIGARGVNVGFSQVGRTQAAPAVEIALLVGVL